MSDSLKIAFIMLCHKNAKQINMLLDKLSVPECDVYIHVDKKSAIRSEINLKDNVFILKESESVNVGWGGYSVIEATLRLIDKVLESKRAYDYIWLISGQDYPIQPMRTIVDRLSENKNIIYIDLVDQHAKNIEHFKKRYEVRHTPWMMKRNVLSKIYRRAYYILTGGYSHTFGMIRRKTPGFDVYFGSQWWCIPYEIIKMIDQTIKDRPEIEKFFSETAIPDESFFQSLVMHVKTEPYTIEDKLVYVDWSNRQNSPRTLLETDWENLRTSKYAFARKFDTECDDKILKRIDDAMDDSQRMSCESQHR